MALDMKNLVAQNPAGTGRKMWSYFTDADNRAAVNGAGYFNDAHLMFEVGDTMMVTSTDHVYPCRISAISAGVVTVAAQSAFS